MPYNESHTGRTLPLKFKSDLNSRTLNIVCRIIIERNNFNTGESKNIVEELNAGKTIAVFNPPEKIDRGIYDSRYHSIHTHHYEILRPLLIMFRYNVGNNKKFQAIDEFINNKNSINVVEVIAGMLDVPVSMDLQPPEPPPTD